LPTPAKVNVHFVGVPPGHWPQLVVGADVVVVVVVVVGAAVVVVVHDVGFDNVSVAPEKSQGLVVSVCPAGNVNDPPESQVNSAVVKKFA